jgi:choline-sulfatase
MPTQDRPNIVLFMTDQQRGDCLGIEGHPVLQTPYIDHIAAEGIRFRRGYAACPVCVPARRTLMTGKRPASHGVFMNYHTLLDGPTLPELLSRAGYQTHLCGKLHLWPERKRYGFMSEDWADSPAREDDDYQTFLRDEGMRMPAPGMAHGSHQNGYVARPFHLEERLHFTNWCADKAMEFLDRRDPTTPFFLKVSFHQPHEPCTPPQAYWDRYMDMELPEPQVGEWARVYDEPQRGLPVPAWRIAVDQAVIKQYRAGYYGTINHIDDQIGRIMTKIPKNTIVLFLSDHGDMIGDHQWLRKRNAFEGSARIPFIVRFPESMGVEQGQVRDEPVELMDVMPTLLEAAGIDTPDTVDGSSLLPLVRGTNERWREYVHGECSTVPTIDSGMQYLTDGHRKYIWYPGTGAEHYFDLDADPNEMHNLADSPAHREELAEWRARLVSELAGRPEGFTDGTELTPVGGPTPHCLPGFEQERFV